MEIKLTQGHHALVDKEEVFSKIAKVGDEDN